MGKGKFSGVSVGTEQAFKHVMENIIKQVDTTGGKGALNLKSLMNYDDLRFGKGSDLVDKLASNMDLQGMAPGMFSVGEDGLDALGELLSGLGFDKDVVEGFLKDLKGDGEKRDVSLSGLLGKLGKFLKDNDAHETMDISALPYFESILSSLGVKPEERKILMGKALGNGDDIDIEQLVSGLGHLQNNSGKSGQPLYGETRFPVDGQMLSGLGMDEEAGGTLTLKDFISKLETKIGQNSGKFIPDSVSNALSETFANNIHVSKKSDGQGTKKSRIDLNGSKDSDFRLNFDKKTFQHKQHLYEDSFEGQMFDGKMGKNVKNAEQVLVKDHTSPFEKAVKEFGTVSKESDEPGGLPGKGVAGSEILQKVASFKSVSLSEKTLPSYVTEQVARQIANAVRNGESEIKFQITPPELGRLELSIETTKSGLRISILAEQNATRDMLLSNTGDLRTLLSDHGIKLDKIDVDLSGNFGQSMAQARQGADNSGKGRRNRDSSEFRLDNTKGDVADESNKNPVRYRKGNLDLVA